MFGWTLVACPGKCHPWMRRSIIQQSLISLTLSKLTRPSAQIYKPPRRPLYNANLSIIDNLCFAQSSQINTVVQINKRNKPTMPEPTHWVPTNPWHPCFAPRHIKHQYNRVNTITCLESIGFGCEIESLTSAR